MVRLFLLIPMVFLGCTEHKLTVADLKFPDPEREGIVRNGVREMLGVASMQISSRDTSFRKTFDQMGRPLLISPYPSQEKIYKYDSLSLPDSLYERAWNVSRGYKVIPTFDDDATVLYLYYFDPHFKADRYVEKLMFDGNGRLSQLDRHYLHHTQFKDIPAYKALNNKPEYTATYFYDDKSRLVKDSSDYEYVVVHRYYYSDHLDSATCTRTDRARFYEKETTYFDASDLRLSTNVIRRADSKQYEYTIAYYYKKW